MTLPKELTTVTSFSKILALILFITLPILSFIFGMNYQKNREEYDMKKIQKIDMLSNYQSDIPTEIDITPMSNPKEINQAEYFERLTTGVELTKTQYSTFMSAVPKSIKNSQEENVLTLTDTKGQWFYWNDIVQNREYLRKDNMVCQVTMAWCGIGNPELECKDYVLKDDDWYKSNNSQCCRSYINKTSHIISCTNTNEVQNLVNTDLNSTINSL